MKMRISVDDRKTVEFTNIDQLIEYIYEVEADTIRESLIRIGYRLSEMDNIKFDPDIVKSHISLSDIESLEKYFKNCKIACEGACTLSDLACNLR